jgi:hypothetical protein
MSKRGAPFSWRGFGEKPIDRSKLEGWEHALLPPEDESDEAKWRRLKREDQLANIEEVMPGDVTNDDGPEDWSTST